MEKLVSELLYCAFNSILYQRDIYQPQFFEKKQKWGVPVMVCTNELIKTYLMDAVKCIKREWFTPGDSILLNVSLILMNNSEPEEIWQFSFQTGQDVQQTLTREDLRLVLRQIHSSVNFLPLLMGGEHTVKISVTENTCEDRPLPEMWVLAPQRAVRNCVQGTFNDVRVGGGLVVTPQVFYKQN